MNEPKTYRFSTFQELLDRVPGDRIQDCMTELGVLLSGVKRVSDLVEAALPDNNRKPALPEFFEWIDDGKGKISIEIKSINKRYLPFNLNF